MIAAHTPITPSRFCLGVLVWVHCRKKWRKTGADFSSSCMTFFHWKCDRSCIECVRKSDAVLSEHIAVISARRIRPISLSTCSRVVGSARVCTATVRGAFRASAFPILLRLGVSAYVLGIPHGSINLTTQLYHSSHSHKNVKHTMTSRDVDIASDPACSLWETVPGKVEQLVPELPADDGRDSWLKPRASATLTKLSFTLDCTYKIKVLIML